MDIHAGPGGRGRRRRAGPGAGVWAAGRRLLAAGCQRWRCAGRARARPRGAACLPGLRRIRLYEAGGGGRRAPVRAGGPPGGGCWRPGANPGGARGACARPRGAAGRVCAGLAELVGTLGCACACVQPWAVRPWATCVRGMRMRRRAHALYARGYAHARRACGRVCRVLVRYVCAQVRPVPQGANKRTMPASRCKARMLQEPWPWFS